MNFDPANTFYRVSNSYMWKRIKSYHINMLHNYFNKKLCNVKVLDKRGNYIIGTIEKKDEKLFFNNLEDKDNIVEFSFSNE
jgi:hypothetical protein